MPYNTTAIPPRREPTGQAQLPLSRVKKIIALDQDISMCSNNAAFVITLATEMFIQYMAKQGHNVVKSERKPRRNIQYRDLANAVSRLDNLEFLIDIVPRTMPFKAIKEQQQSRETPNSTTSNGAGPSGPRQTTLDGNRRPSSSAAAATTNGVMNGFIEGNVGLGSEEQEEQDHGDREDTEEDPDAQLREEIRGRASTESVGVANGDVEMS